VFDTERKGVISLDIIGTIMELLGHEVDEDDLDEILDEYDEVRRRR
jgi:calmodulin